MIVTLRTERIRTLGQVRAFLEGNQPADFELTDRTSAYALVRRTLVRFEYHGLRKPDKGLLRRFIEKVTGFSRAQVTRLIRQHRRTGNIRDHRCKPPANAFRRRYTPLDAALLAEVDKAFGQLSGPATKVILWRMCHVYGDERFERLAHLSNGQIYNLRKSREHRTGRLTFRKTRPTPVPIGIRRKPQPDSQPGFLRVDTVHLGDRAGKKGHLPRQHRRRSHAVPTPWRRAAHHPALHGARAEGPHLRLPLHRPGLPRRQRKRVHQPPGRRPPQRAPHPHQRPSPGPATRTTTRSSSPRTAPSSAGGSATSTSPTPSSPRSTPSSTTTSAPSSTSTGPASSPPRSPAPTAASNGATGNRMSPRPTSGSSPCPAPKTSFGLASPSKRSTRWPPQPPTSTPPKPSNAPAANSSAPSARPETPPHDPPRADRRLDPSAPRGAPKGGGGRTASGLAVRGRK